MNRTDRLLGIVLDLQARGRLRAEDLAARYETSVRTIYRDVSALCETGVPIVAMPGAGYELGPGYFLPPLALAIDEAAALALGADYIAQMQDEHYSDAARRAAEKIATSLPSPIRTSLDETRKAMRFVATPLDDGPEREHVRLLRDAIARSRVVRFRYFGPYGEDAAGRGEERRRLAPYVVLQMAGRWYVAGHSYERNALRFFRISRIEELAIEAEVFERPPDFALDERREMPRGDIEVRVRFAPALERAFRERTRFLAPAIVPSGDGACEAVFYARSLDDVQRWILGWGEALRVVAPVELAGRVRDAAARIAAAYLT